MSRKNLFLVLLGCVSACLLMAAFVPSPAVTEAQEEMVLVFEDDFDGKELDTARWNRATRGNSMWSRWISDSPEVVSVKRGRLVCRAIPNADRGRDSVPMLTGAVWTKGKFTFQYGRVEVRMRTNLQPGNFPAAWMGRNWSAGNVPPYGEIDIVEMVGEDSQARHAWHSEYTTRTPKHGLKNSFMKKVDVTKWHVYAIDWTPDAIVWYIDGKETGRYDKPQSATRLAQQEWTFDVPFYLLLNQSIMHGAHGIEADLEETYETQFDWIRVYQRRNIRPNS